MPGSFGLTAYAGFGELYDAKRRPGPITEAACWARGRRNFFELADLRKAPLAIEAVRCIDGNLRHRARDQRARRRGPLRGIALGRKAWLFAGSDRGGERAAAICTLIGTAKVNDVAPQAGSPKCCGVSPTTRLRVAMSFFPGTGRKLPLEPSPPDPTVPRSSPDAYDGSKGGQLIVLANESGGTNLGRTG